MINHARRVWEAALGELELEIAKPSYEALLKGTVGLALEQDTLTIGAPNSFIAELLEKRMYAQIQKTVSRLTDRSLLVSFRVSSDDSNHTAVNTPLSHSFPADGTRAGANHTLESTPVDSVSLNPKYSFSNFVVSTSNQLAHAASWAIATQATTKYNPLFIYSRVGLGKTHLLHSIGHQLASSGAKVVYVTTEQFTNEFISAIREGKSHEFRLKYRRCDVLLIDDIQFIIGKEQTQEGLFHTFNELHNSNKQIVISSDRLPSELPLLDDRLRSRFDWGLTTDIQIPDKETRLAILQKKAQASGADVPDAVLSFLSDKVYESVRDLEGALNRVIAFSAFTKRPINLDLAKQYSGQKRENATLRTCSPAAILQCVAQFYKISELDLKKSRHVASTSPVGTARHVSMYLMRALTKLSFAQIGATMGSKGHSSALRAFKLTSKRISCDPSFNAQVSDLKRQLS
jgi:chromosomal replication initiator protein